MQTVLWGVEEVQRRASCMFARCKQCRRYFEGQTKLKNIDDFESDTEGTEDVDDTNGVGTWGAGTPPP